MTKKKPGILPEEERYGPEKSTPNKPDLHMIVKNFVRLNVRKFPDKNAQILKSLPMRTKMEVEVVDPVWYHVLSVDGAPFDGYIQKFFVTEV